MIGGNVVVGSQDSVSSLEELEQRTDVLKDARFKAIKSLTPLDIRIVFDGDVFVDFCATLRDDHVVHVFFPEDRYLEFATPGGWVEKPTTPP